MDHSSAHLMACTEDPILTETIHAGSAHGENEHALAKGDKAMHHKEQNLHNGFYKELSAVIRDYGDVLLFGPTEAKQELFNFLKKDQHFSKIKIEVQQADKMTENQEHAFVRKYFGARK